MTNAQQLSGPTVCVIGSTNVDMVVNCPHLPRPGETISNGTFHRSPGGKGANQALAASHAGAKTTFIGAIGDDGLGDEALATLRSSGVDLSCVVTVSGTATGVALIAVDAAGENQIAVAPGANHKLNPGDLQVGGFDAVLCQMEIRDDTLAAAAAGATGLFILNAAPARTIPEAVLERADIIIVNETENEFLSEQLVQFAGTVILTEGAKGATAFKSGVRLASAVPPEIDPVDTVGAGDAFCGTLTAHLASGVSLGEALERACEAGAVAATQTGAQSD